MGGGFSKQSLTGRATSYTFHPIRRESEENNNKSKKNSSPQENNDDVITNPAKLLDDPRKNKDGGHYLNYNEKARNLSSPCQSVSSPTYMEHTFENSKLEQQTESAHVSESNNSTPNRSGQGEDDRESNYNEESDDDYGRRISDYDGLIGSPSFRDYCMKDYLKTDSNTCDGKKVETKTTKKERKGRRIKKVISIGNPSAMRNLLHVTACYNPTVSISGHMLPKPI